MSLSRLYIRRLTASLLVVLVLCTLARSFFGRRWLPLAPPVSHTVPGAAVRPQVDVSMELSIIPLSDSEVRVVFDFKDDAQDERRTYAHVVKVRSRVRHVCVLCCARPVCSSVRTWTTARGSWRPRVWWLQSSPTSRPQCHACPRPRASRSSPLQVCVRAPKSPPPSGPLPSAPSLGDPLQSLCLPRHQ